MPPAARVGDPTPHGAIAPPGCLTVIIGGMPAANTLCMSACGVPPPAGPHITPFLPGSATVFIGGAPALRMNDQAPMCGPILTGCPTVQIGG